MIGNGVDTVQKFLDLTKYVYDCILKNCPRSEKYTYCADARHSLWIIGGRLKRASVVYSKADKLRLLESADEDLSELRFMMEAGMELKLVPIEKYKQFCIKVTEVGKMLGGWLKYARQA
ncbi:MAG: four helix bundle protein [Treponema sp.]|jgi:four helix bundle protein|nr:four helix bundle protein [Treponema sp.]